MQGVEDIPESVLTVGIRWNWETFGEYTRAMDRMPHSLDFMTLVPHDALPLYVMDERAAHGEVASDDDLS